MVARRAWQKASDDFTSFVEEFFMSQRLPTDEDFVRHAELLELERAAYRSYRFALRRFAEYAPNEYRQLTFFDLE